MLFDYVLCVCFVALLSPKIETNAQLDSNTVKPEAIFADVIKNISRVNNELQNLINSYQQFKRTHDSQEDFDAEDGRVNRNSKTKKRKPSGKITTKSYQTEMIYDEENEKKSSEAKSSSEVEKSSQAQHSSEEEKSHEEEPKKHKENTGKIKHNIPTETSITNEEPTDVPLQKEETEPNNEEFLDIHQDMKIKTDRLKRILSEAYQEPNNTKYIEDEKQTKYLGGNSKQPSESDTSAEGDGYTEKKEGDVAVKVPQERAFSEKQVEVTAGVYLRSHVKENTMTTKKPDNGSQSLESTDNDEDLSRDVFKTNVLRQAYGDACLKLVIRKCHQACKFASTITCRGAVKCKPEFKDFFKKKAKSGCLDAFNVTSLRRLADLKSIDGGNIMTREGFLSVACQTSSPGRRDLEKLKPAKNNTEPLNILRDKYERACSKISQKKCTSACHYAEEESCAKFECKKNLKKIIRKNCKSACKKYYYTKSKSSSSGSDKDSDKDSDDDSDTGSSDDDKDSSSDDDKS